MIVEAEAYRRLTKVFRSVFYEDAITLRPEMTAADVGGWDSIAHISLIVATEAEFAMEFDTRELEELNTVSDLVAVIERKGS